MKRFLILLLALGMIVSLSGCYKDALDVRNAIKKSTTITDVQSKIELTLKTNVSEELLGSEASSFSQLFEEGIVLETKTTDRKNYEIKGTLKSDQLLRDNGLWEFPQKPGFEALVFNQDKIYTKTSADSTYLFASLSELLSLNDEENSEAYANIIEAQQQVSDLTVKMASEYLDQYEFTLGNVSNLGTSSLTLPDGTVQVKKIKISLNEEQMKNMVSYTLGNLAESVVIKDYLLAVNAIQQEGQLPIGAGGETLEQMYQGFQDSILALKTVVDDFDLQQTLDGAGTDVHVDLTFSIDDTGYIRQEEANLIIEMDSPTGSTEKARLELTSSQIFWNINNVTPITEPTSDAVSITAVLEDANLLTRWDEKSYIRIGLASYMEAIKRSKQTILHVGEEFAFINGQYSDIGVSPYVKNGRTMIPLRVVADAFDAELGWDPATKGVTILADPDLFLVMHIGSKNATVNGQSVILDEPPAIINGRTMVPLRFVSEALGAQVEWVPETRQIILQR